MFDLIVLNVRSWSCCGAPPSGVPVALQPREADEIGDRTCLHPAEVHVSAGEQGVKCAFKRKYTHLYMQQLILRLNCVNETSTLCCAAEDLSGIVEKFC